MVPPPRIRPTPRSPDVAARPSAEATPARGEERQAVTLDADVFDQIRREIKARLPYFQACANAARRRGSPDVRRLMATWSIATDGAITQLNLEGVSDPRLATCITRMGSHPLSVKPGMELTIPTPIVFVR